MISKWTQTKIKSHSFINQKEASQFNNLFQKIIKMGKAKKIVDESEEVEEAVSEEEVDGEDNNVEDGFSEEEE